jgi:hypothetical protein
LPQAILPAVRLQFRRAHARAGNDGNAAPLYLGHPKFEGFEVKQTLDRHGKAA